MFCGNDAGHSSGNLEARNLLPTVSNPEFATVKNEARKSKLLDDRLEVPEEHETLQFLKVKSLPAKREGYF